MKTEKEKMLAGELYDASDPQLVQERRRARLLTHRLNVLDYGREPAYRQILSELLPNAAADVWIEPPFLCDYGYNIYTGEKVYFNYNCVLLDVMPIRIGSNVLFGPNVQIYTATHPLDAVQRRTWLEFARPVAIGDDCWIGGSAVISPGVTIGDGCIVGAGAVVTKDVPAGTIVVGNPARPLARDARPGSRLARIFLSVKYHPDHRNRELIEKLSGFLRQNGLETVCILQDIEKWGQVDYPPEQLMQLTFAEIDRSDLVIVDLSEKGVGLGIEAGYARARGIPVLTIARRGSEISATLQGISAAVLFYDDMDNFGELLAEVRRLMIQPDPLRNTV